MLTQRFKSNGRTLVRMHAEDHSYDAEKINMWDSDIDADHGEHLWESEFESTSNASIGLSSNWVVGNGRTGKI